MSNPAADYPTSIHSSTDVGSLADSYLGASNPTHTEVHGKLENEIVAVQTKVGTGSSTPASGQFLKATGSGASAWGSLSLSDISGVTASATEINYLVGVTSAIQTQLNSKAASSHTHTKSDLTDISDFLLESEVDADIKTLSLPASTTISAFGATLVDDADAATARTTLGLAAGGAGDIWVEKGGDTMTGQLINSFNGGATTLSLSNTTAGTGLTIGGDVNLYRSAANVLKTDDFLDLTVNTTDQPISGSGLGDKLGLYSSTLASRYGLGVQSNELVAYMPSGAGLTVRTAAASGAASSGTVVAKMGNVGPGTTAGVTLGSSGDVNLYRYGADQLATSDKFYGLRGLGRTNIIMSPEATDNSVIPYFTNDIAYNRLRGGACRVYYDGVLQGSTDSNTDKMFDATAEAFSINSTGITEVIVEVDMCVSLSYGTKVGIAVNPMWKSTNIKVEVYTTATTTWTTLYNGTWDDGEMFWSHGGSANPISKLRYTFSGFNLTYNIFRIGTIYTLNYASSLGADLFFTRNGGSIWGNTTLQDGVNIITNTTTGTKIGTGTTQKLGFWNATPVVQPTTSTTAATIVGGGGTNITDTDTFDGYTLAKVVKALRNAGLLA